MPLAKTVRFEFVTMNCRYNNALIIDERITRLFLFLTIFAFLPFYRSLFIFPFFYIIDAYCKNANPFQRTDRSWYLKRSIFKWNFKIFLCSTNVFNVRPEMIFSCIKIFQFLNKTSRQIIVLSYCSITFIFLSKEINVKMTRATMIL